ncbi:hypothetical protein HPB49_012614 [Dermacentor silvarum]|uniref:Uncharacterized protein n=1 Tax=Dermacentor silvarum TaxID=543639 RepID=A0ACB8C9A6_DERSI|nr:hypothetical protein HPB49_012614 [Dermacentor silvarum]
MGSGLLRKKMTFRMLQLIHHHRQNKINYTWIDTLSRLYKDYATITWTINGRLLKNLIDRSTLSTVKNDGPVKVSKIAINQLERLRSDNGKFVFECTALSTCRSPRQPSRLVPSSRTRARATRSASLAGPRAARAATPQAIRAREPKSKHLTCRTATGLG